MTKSSGIGVAERETAFTGDEGFHRTLRSVILIVFQRIGGGDVLTLSVVLWWEVCIIVGSTSVRATVDGVGGALLSDEYGKFRNSGCCATTGQGSKL